MIAKNNYIFLRIMKLKMHVIRQDVCNGDMKRFPGGVVCTSEFSSEGFWVIWYCS